MDFKSDILLSIFMDFFYFIFFLTKLHRRCFINSGLYIYIIFWPVLDAGIGGVCEKADDFQK